MLATGAMQLHHEAEGPRTRWRGAAERFRRAVEGALLRVARAGACGDRARVDPADCAGRASTTVAPGVPRRGVCVPLRAGLADQGVRTGSCHGGAGGRANTRSALALSRRAPRAPGAPGRPRAVVHSTPHDLSTRFPRFRWTTRPGDVGGVSAVERPDGRFAAQVEGERSGARPRQLTRSGKRCARFWCACAMALVHRVDGTTLSHPQGRASSPRAPRAVAQSGAHRGRTGESRQRRGAARSICKRVYRWGPARAGASCGPLGVRRPGPRLSAAVSAGDARTIPGCVGPDRRR